MRVDENLPATAPRKAASTTRMLLGMKYFAAALVLLLAALSFGQTPAPAASDGAAAAATPSSVLRPALSQVQSVTAALNVRKWKAPGSVRKAAQEDVDSIQRDLGTTLPALLAAADAAPGSVPPNFAVYRNLDALYDVVLRVAQTADLAAPSGEASALASSLQQLEAARSALGQSILQTSQRREAEIVALEAQVRRGRGTTEARHSHETVIDDGPVEHTTRKRRKVVHKKTSETTKKPAASTAKPSAGTESH